MQAELLSDTVGAVRKRRPVPAQLGEHKTLVPLAWTAVTLNVTAFPRSSC